jgi:hypothetical protein
VTRPARLALAAAVLAVACAAHRHGAAKASVVRADIQCGGEATGASARWISTEGALRAALGAGGVFGVEAPSPAIDFAKEGVLAVSMGQRPTAGYGLALQDDTVTIADGVGTVVVRFEEPAPGAILAQVLTSPCLLVRLPKQGLREVRVVDPAGVLRASVMVP